MTICGFAITAPDHAIVWADQELFRGDALWGHQSKIFLNPSISAVATGCGSTRILDAAEWEFSHSANFETLMTTLPRVLRAAEMKCHPHATGPQATFAIVGWSERYHRLLGAALEGGYFVPVHTRRWCCPDLGELDSLHPASLDDILPLAMCQAANIKKTYPTSRGGWLVGAEIHGRTVTGRPLIDMTTTSAQLATGDIKP